MKRNGFTIIELLVVISVMVVISTIVVARYRTGERQYTLQLAAQEVMSNIRKVQNMAISSHEYNNQIPAGGFGIHFVTSSADSYILYADLDGDYSYNTGEEMETVALNREVEIDSLSDNPLNIVFTPPDPTVNISGGVNGVITLKLKKGTGTKTITVTPRGVIEIN